MKRSKATRRHSLRVSFINLRTRMVKKQTFKRKYRRTHWASNRIVDDDSSEASSNNSNDELNEHMVSNEHVDGGNGESSSVNGENSNLGESNTTNTSNETGNNTRRRKMAEYVKKVKDLDLNGDISENWRRWKRDWEEFRIATELDSKSETIQIATLKNMIGSEARDLYDTFDISEDDDDFGYDAVVAAFANFCEPKKREIYERFVFYNRNQKDGESFDAYLMELKRLIRTCNFDNDEEMIRDRIVIGIQSKKLQSKLLAKDDLTYKLAVDMCRADEATFEASSKMKRASNVHQVRRWNNGNTNNNSNRYDTHRSRHNANGAKNNNSSITNGANGSGNKSNWTNGRNTGQSGTCNYCGYVHKDRVCPALNKRCTKCNKMNHFSSVCRSKGVNSISNDYDDFFINSINSEDMRCTSSGRLKTWQEAVTCNGSKVTFKIDSGADVSIAPVRLLRDMGTGIELKPTATTLNAFGGDKIKPIGKCHLPCATNEAKKTIEFFVVSFDTMPMLGLNDAIDLKIIKIGERNVNKLSSHAKNNNEGGSVANGVRISHVIEEFGDVFSGIGKFDQKYDIKLKEDAVPKAVAPRKVPLMLTNKLKAKLNELEKEKIIEKATGYSEWVSHLVIVEKKDGSLRLCIDPQALNNAICDEKFLLPSFDQLSARLHDAKFFSVLDLSNGFFHIQLTERSQQLCTFATPFGNYRFLRLPFGIKTGSQVFQKMNHAIFGDIDNVEIFIDDLLIFGKTQQEHDETLKKVLQRAREKHVKFNKEKMQIGLAEVKYLGHVFAQNKITPDPKRIEAIKGLKHPTTKRSLQSFLGVVNYMRSFIPNMSELTAPLRELLKTNVIFQWTELHAKIIEDIKDAIINSPILVPFDIEKELVIQCDASQNGLGCCLLQEGKPISFASRSLTKTEQNYSQIEKEMLAILFACTKFKFYTYGRRVKVVSDHKPLLSIIKKDIHTIPSAKLQRMRLKLLNFDIELQFAPGKSIHIADYLSRHFIDDDTPEDESISEAILTINVSDEKRIEFQRETESDDQLKKVKQYCKAGWPNDKSKCNTDVKMFYKLRNEIVLEDDLLFYNERLIVPKSMRQQMLKALHESHFGMVKTKRRARDTIYWPRIDNEIEDMVEKCEECQKHQRRMQKEPLICHDIPDRPFEKIACDILEHAAKNYLVIVDYYSKWIEVLQLRGKSASQVNEKLMQTFATFGIPKVIVADNNPFNSLECNEFAKANDFTYQTSSPRYPRSNGMAERAVQIVKNILRKTKTDVELQSALLEYRNTPTKDMQHAPSQLIQNRMLRAKLPMHNNKFIPNNRENINQQLANKAARVKYYHDKNAKSRPDFLPNEKVLVFVNDAWQQGKIVSAWHTPRSYVVEVTGKTYRRNSSHIKRHEWSDAGIRTTVIPARPEDVHRTRSGKVYNRS